MKLRRWPSFANPLGMNVNVEDWTLGSCLLSAGINRSRATAFDRIKTVTLGSQGLLTLEAVRRRLVGSIARRTVD